MICLIVGNPVRRTDTHALAGAGHVGRTSNVEAFALDWNDALRPGGLAPALAGRGGYDLCIAADCVYHRHAPHVARGCRGRPPDALSAARPAAREAGAIVRRVTSAFVRRCVKGSHCGAHAPRVA